MNARTAPQAVIAEDEPVLRAELRETLVKLSCVAPSATDRDDVRGQLAAVATDEQVTGSQGATRAAVTVTIPR